MASELGKVVIADELTRLERAVIKNVEESQLNMLLIACEVGYHASRGGETLQQAKARIMKALVRP